MSRRVKRERKSYAESSSSSDSRDLNSDVTSSAFKKKSKYFESTKKTYEGRSSESERYTSMSEAASEASENTAESDRDSSPRPFKKRKSVTTPRIDATDSLNGQNHGSSPDCKLGSDDHVQKGEVFVRKLPALPAGDTPYKSVTIHPNTMLFLQDLKEHNERDWFQQRDLQFRAAKTDFEEFVAAFARTIQTHDDTIPELPVKDLVFRIYRDVRFSNDRTPYKTNMSAAFSRTGRKGAFACYYLSIEPHGKSMLGCGSWCPPADSLRAIRRHIDRHPEQWDQILQRPEFIEFFKGEKGLLESRDKLKTCPKGYDKSHKRIELLKLKSFTIGMNFSDEEVKSDDFLQIVDVVVQQMVPFITLLNSIIAPDEPASSSAEEEV